MSEALIDIASDYGIFAVIMMLSIIGLAYLTKYIFRTNEEREKRYMEHNRELISNNKILAESYQESTQVMKNMQETQKEMKCDVEKKLDKHDEKLNQILQNIAGR